LPLSRHPMGFVQHTACSSRTDDRVLPIASRFS
jgi:hypothetical protein